MVTVGFPSKIEALLVPIERHPTVFRTIQLMRVLEQAYGKFDIASETTL